MNKEIMIIISPSKTQSDKYPVDPKTPRPKTLDMAREIFGKIRPLNIEETKKMFSLSDSMAEKVWQIHQDHGKEIFNAIEMFNGTVFKELKLDEYDKEWVDKHVRIIDPLYGILRPYDTTGLYRLDYTVPFFFNIKEFWRDTVNKELEGYRIINLASKEYSSIVDLPMETPKLEEGNSIKQQRGKTLHKILKNKGL